MYYTKIISLITISFLTLGCEPAPQEILQPLPLTTDATGYYCGMIVLNHSGPKGQVQLSNREQPLWFTSVRDTLAFARSPEEPKNITAIFVNNMENTSWEKPGDDTWIDARTAWYVLDSGRTGGMGAPESIPFGSQQSATTFTEKHGGRILGYNDIPDEWLFGSH